MVNNNCLVVTGTMDFYDFPETVGKNNPIWRTPSFFQRGRSTTNQLLYDIISTVSYTILNISNHIITNILVEYHYPWRIHMYAIYGVPWIPSTKTTFLYIFVTINMAAPWIRHLCRCSRLGAGLCQRSQWSVRRSARDEVPGAELGRSSSWSMVDDWDWGWSKSLQLWPEIPVLNTNKNPIYRMYNPIRNNQLEHVITNKWP